jgi:hypothetical protein
LECSRRAADARLYRQPHIVKPATHQLPERGAGALDEHLRRRRLRRRRGRVLDLAADRLANPRELRVETPASVRSITARVNGSRSAKYPYVCTGSSRSSSAVRIRGRRTATRRPPRVIDPSSWP